MADVNKMASDILKEYSHWGNWIAMKYRPYRVYCTSTNMSIITVTLLAVIMGSLYVLRKRRRRQRRMYVNEENEEDNIDVDRITDQWMKRLDTKLDDKIGKKDKNHKVKTDTGLPPQNLAGPPNCPFKHLFGDLLDANESPDYHQLATAFPVMEDASANGDKDTMAMLAHQIKKSIREREITGEKLEVIGNNLLDDSAEDEDDDYMEDMPTLTDKKKQKERDAMQFAMHIPGELKKIENKITTREMEKSLTERQRLDEADIRRQQLEQIFKLMEQEKDKFGEQDNAELEEQMRMYAL